VNVLEQINAEMAVVVARAQRSLVQISNGRHGQGAGVLWHADGLIVTNAHVVRRQALQVTLADGRSLPARVLASAPNVDLAVLSVAAHGLPPIEPRKAWPLRPGQWVLALGHPWGVTGAATAGIVIGLGKPPEMPRFPGELLQVSLHLRPGHSGGPLVDEHGHLVGLNMMMAGPDIGLAVPLPVVKDFIAQVVNLPCR
jgi:S1-C subfamily serine protease